MNGFLSQDKCQSSPDSLSQGYWTHLKAWIMAIFCIFSISKDNDKAMHSV